MAGPQDRRRCGPRDRPELGRCRRRGRDRRAGQHGARRGGPGGGQGFPGGQQQGQHGQQGGQNQQQVPGQRGQQQAPGQMGQQGTLPNDQPSGQQSAQTS
ncbi:hypothetical protein ON003_07160 [Janibacter hoylei]|uniref:hypothetical protein n=1 Tax=Janibacter hoylei TaxID=364298 RepID=UPI0022384898|nr:hypothetical protein [Janibacter hoylei]MCW4601396.1 hypothetical protein [Janibacter hoylei]